MHIFAIFDFINIFLAVFLCALVYSRNPSGKLNRIFIANALISAYTAVCEFFRVTSNYTAAAIFWHKASFLWPFLPFFFYQFVLTYTKNNLNANKIIKWVLVVFAISIAILHLFTGVLYKELVHQWYGWEYDPAPNIYAVFVMVYFTASGFISLLIIYGYYMNQVDIKKRRQALYTLTGLSIPILCPMIAKGVLPHFSFNVPPLESIYYIIGSIFLSLSVLRYKSFLINPLDLMKKLFATISDYMIVFDREGEILLTSKYLLENVKFKEDEIRGYKIDRFIKNGSASIIEKLPELIGKEIELELQTRDYKNIPISASMSIIQGESTDENLYLLLGKDISERKLHEDELLQFKVDLMEKVKMRTAELAKSNIDLQLEIHERKEIEIALRESEKRYRNLFENSPIGIYRTTPDGKILLVNPAIVKMLGFDSTQELIQRNLEKEGFDESGNSRTDFKRKIESFGSVSGFESKWIKKDGSIITVRENAKCIYDDNSKVLYYEGTVEDITEQIIATNSLKESEEKFRNLAEQSPNIIFIYQDKRIIYINDKCMEVTGYEREYFTSTEFEWENIITPASFAKAGSLFERVKRGDNVSFNEYTVIKKSGGFVDILVSTSDTAYLGKSATLGIITDITYRIKAEKAIKESEERFRNLIENINEIFYISDNYGRCVYVSPNVYYFTGFSTNYWIGEKVLKFVSKEDFKRVLRFYIDNRENGILDASIEFRAVKKDGTIFWVEQITRFVRDDDGSLIEYRNVTRDITQRKEAENKLQLLAQAVRSTGEGISITDINNNLLFVNDAFINIYGYTEDELIGKNIQLVRIPNNPQPKIEEIRLATIQTGWSGELINRKKDGSEFPIYLSTSCVVNEKGEPYALVGVSRDITLSKETEIALIESEARYRSIFDNTSVAMLLIDPNDQSIKGANKAACEYYGYKNEEFLTMSISHLEMPEEIVKDKLLTTGMDNQGETYRTHKLANGDLRDVEVHSGIIKIRNHEVIFSIIYDITRRRKAERQLEEYKNHLENLVAERTQKLDKLNKRLKKELKKLKTAEENIEDQLTFLQTLIDTIPNPIFMRSPQKIYTGCNKAFETFHSLKKDDLIGKTVYDIYPLEIAETSDEKDEEIFNHHQEQQYEINAIDKDGVQHDVVVYKAAFYKIDGSIGGVVGVILDITEIKKLEKEIIKALEKEKELSELKSRFISVASHEFRTPLTAILASADLLELYGKKWPVEKYYEYLRNIQNAVQYMNELINDVLTVNKSESNKIKFTPAETNLYELLTSLLDNIKLSSPENIKFVFDYNTGEKIFNIDNKLITQIVTNLLSNAVKYSPNGGKINITAHKKDYNIILSVCDQGIGISEEDLKLLFEPFHRGQNVGPISGTGLGLSIAKKSAEMHHGSLAIQSKLNEGTKVIVTLKCE